MVAAKISFSQRPYQRYREAQYFVEVSRFAYRSQIMSKQSGLSEGSFGFLELFVVCFASGTCVYRYGKLSLVGLNVDAA